MLLRIGKIKYAFEHDATDENHKVIIENNKVRIGIIKYTLEQATTGVNH